MKRCSLLLSLAVALCAVALLSCVPEAHAAHPCGIVYDGLGEGQFDLNTQTATSTIAAHWFGFDTDVLNFEWAVVSSALSAYLPVPGSCEQFRKVPDVMDWTNAHRSKSASASNLRLSVGETYFALVRSTYNDGKQVVASSDGVLVVAPKLSATPQTEAPQRKARTVTVDVNTVSDTCSIDAANRCRQSTQSVGALLKSMYGDPVFNPESPIALLFLVGSLPDRARAGIFPHTPFTQHFQRDYEGIGLVGKSADFGNALIPPPPHSSDDDDGYISGDAPAWVIAPIAVGIFLCGLVVFLLLLVLRVFRRGDRDAGGSSSGSGGSFAAGADASEKKDYAGRNNIGVANTSDRTDISFPDTAIRRLSITHNDTNVEDLEEATRSPRRKHPIMQSTSSSFRDYRNNT